MTSKFPSSTWDGGASGIGDYTKVLLFIAASKNRDGLGSWPVPV